MTWVVSWHEGNGSMVEAAEPVGTWFYITKKEADEMYGRLEKVIEQGAMHDCWLRIVEILTPFPSKDLDKAVMAFLERHYEDEALHQQWRRNTAIATAKGHWFVFEDTSPADPPEVQQPEMFGWDSHFAGTRNVLALHLGVDPNTGIGTIDRPASLWVNGVMLEGDTPTDIVKAFTAGMKGNTAIVEATGDPGELAKAIKKTREEFRRNNIEPLTEVPDDVLRSLGVIKEET